MSLKVPRWRLRSALLVVAVLALLLAGGVQWRRRYKWYWQMELIHRHESQRIEDSIIADPSLSIDEANSQFRLVHWHGYTSALYLESAFWPWRSYRADPMKPFCICRVCRARPWLPPEALRVPDIAGKTL